MTEEEKEAIETRKHIIEIDEGLYGEDSENFKTDKIILNYIDKLQKELEEKTTILMAGADKVKQLEKENAELKEDNSHQWEERCRLTFELERLQEEKEKINKVADKMYEYISYYGWEDFESNTGCNREDMVDYFYKE